MNALAPRRTLRSASLAILLAILPLLAGCGKSPGGTPAARPPVPIETAVAELRDVPIRLHGVGNARASELVTVRPQVTAILTAVHFTEGGSVTAGEALFQLDGRSAAAALAQAEADLERARAAQVQAEAVVGRDQAQLALAESDDRRTAELARQSLATPQQVEQVQAARQVAQAAMAADQAAAASARGAVASAAAAVARARLEAGWCTIQAPISGRTGPLGMTTGNLAVAGQTALVTIARTQPMHLEFSLPAGTLPAIRDGLARGPLAIAAQPEGAAGPGTAGPGPATGAAIEAAADGPANGVLDLIDNQVDPATGTIRLRGTFPNTDDRLWPGQQCQVELTVGIERQAVTVPERAVQAGQQGSLVWVVAADRTVSPRTVIPGRVVDGRAIIASGLAAGETVVIDGQIRLVRGATVATGGEGAGDPAAAGAGPATRAGIPAARPAEGGPAR